MWAIMMAAMMLPSALPMIIIHRKMSSKSTSGVSTAVFTAAYLIIWSVFSIFAVTTQFFAHGLGVLNPSDLTLSTLFSAIVLIAAGGFQFTKLKDTCLKACQSPAGFFITGDLYVPSQGGLYFHVPSQTYFWFLFFTLNIGVARRNDDNLRFGNLNLFWANVTESYWVLLYAFSRESFV